MPRVPRPRTALLFAVPIAVHAGAFALWPPDEPGLEGALPRFVTVCAAACAVAWLAVPSSEGPAAPAGAVSSLGLATLGAGAFSFVGCLSYALANAGQLDAVIVFGLGIFALLAATCALILAYVLGSAFDVSPPVTVLAIATHVAAIAPLMAHHSRPAASLVAALAAAVSASAFAFRKRKPAP